jgi:hypothetical protein
MSLDDEVYCSDGQLKEKYWLAMLWARQVNAGRLEELTSE